MRLIDLDDNEKLVGVARAEREEEREEGAAPEDLPEEGESELDMAPESGSAEAEE